MERFRPLISQSSNFVDPLTAGLATDDDAVSLGEDPMNSISSGAATERLSSRSEDHFSVSHRGRLLGGTMPYEQEWIQICKCAGTESIQNLGRTGEMRTCRFRSICWFLYLGVLPEDHTQWLKVIRVEREKYENIRLKLSVTPDVGNIALDPLLNNPLSQHEQSPWNQYFEDSELKKLIRQDVIRTFPEVEFFQSTRIRDMMVTVLFCYARQNPKISYRQGMHEVLAPFIFVLHCDHQTHQHANEMDPTSMTGHQLSTLQELMDEAYLEHDAYCLFEGVMKGLEPWYIVCEHMQQPDPRSNIINAQPFARPQDIGPTNLLVQKLTSIHDNLLQRHDVALYNHLARLEIPPQIYGIRWVRLLFGREFPLHDLLNVWDAIFADCQATFPLVDFLTVAMLSFIREPLLGGDYTTCLNFLMRYPASADVQYIIMLALHLRNPKQYPKPAGYSGAASRHIPTVGGRPDVHRAPQILTAPVSQTRSSSVPRTQPQHIGKKRSTSGDQAPSFEEVTSGRRLSSPNAFTDPQNAAVIFSNSSNVRSSAKIGTSDSWENNQGTTRASKVVSGLVRLGGKLGRPRELSVTRHQSLQSPQSPSPNTVAFVMSHGASDEVTELTPAMKELSVVRTKSAPVAMRSDPLTSRCAVSHSSDDSEEDSSERKQSGDNSSEVAGMTVEDLAAICIGCAMNLSHHTAALKTRLAQLQVQPDLTVRTALDGITEVVETLSGVRSQLAGSNGGSNGLMSAPAQHHPLETNDANEPIT
ncbi:TBC1 domain family member 5 isoform X2 [Palaemon carinicauda]|uniref:TBC1 domain family member 5 isoform X2 n=1 Tax=Palaemon carinicauda TaxID=392227 RepID=UPI0035B59976